LCQVFLSIWVIQTKFQCRLSLKFANKVFKWEVENGGKNFLNSKFWINGFLPILANMNFHMQFIIFLTLQYLIISTKIVNNKSFQVYIGSSYNFYTQSKNFYIKQKFPTKSNFFFTQYVHDRWACFHWCQSTFLMSVHRKILKQIPETRFNFKSQNAIHWWKKYVKFISTLHDNCQCSIQLDLQIKAYGYVLIWLWHFVSFQSK